MEVKNRFKKIDEEDEIPEETLANLIGLSIEKYQLNSFYNGSMSSMNSFSYNDSKKENSSFKNIKDEVRGSSGTKNTFLRDSIDENEKKTDSKRFRQQTSIINSETRSAGQYGGTRLAIEEAHQELDSAKSLKNHLKNREFGNSNLKWNKPFRRDEKPVPNPFKEPSSKELIDYQLEELELEMNLMDENVDFSFAASKRADLEHLNEEASLGPKIQCYQTKKHLHFVHEARPLFQKL